MKTAHNVRLTSAEMATLWAGYMNDSMSICVLSYFLEKNEDAEIREVIEYALQLSKKHVQTITGIMQGGHFPLPVGFTDQDVNLSAPRLYSDVFFLEYVYSMTRIGLETYSVALPVAARSEINDFFSECLSSASELCSRSMQLMLSKGIFARPPFISTPDKVDFVTKQNFMMGFFGQKRPLNAIEITHLYLNMVSNIMGRSLLIGLSQVAGSQQVRQCMVRGAQISGKHIETFGARLTESNLPSPSIWDADVTNSTKSPFSDKLILFHTSALCAAGIGNYGAALAACMRRDLSAMYARLAAETGLYAEDIAELMIEQGWLEQPPQADDREALAKK